MVKIWEKVLSIFVPMIQREPRNCSSDCHFCSIDDTSNFKNKKTIFSKFFGSRPLVAGLGVKDKTTAICTIFKQENDLLHCSYIDGLMNEFVVECKKEEWRLFIDFKNYFKGYSFK